MKCTEVVKISKSGIPYYAWDSVPDKQIVSLETSTYSVWLAGCRRNDVWSIHALYEGGQQGWPNDGAEIRNHKTGQIRYVEFDQIRIHPNVLKKTRKKRGKTVDFDQLMQSTQKPRKTRKTRKNKK